MLIRLERLPQEINADYVFGQLHAVPDAADLPGFACLSQEPPERADRLYLPGECALPAGDYNVRMTWSPRHRRDVPMLTAIGPDVERRAFGYRLGMRIHPGVRVEFACGELIVGLKRAGRTLVECAAAFDGLVHCITQAVDAGEAVELSIGRAQV